MSTWLITGSSRGIGLGIVKHLSSDANNLIFAACRDPAGASQLISVASAAKAKIHLVKLVADDPESIQIAAGNITQVIKNARLDYLVNNAATHFGSSTALEITPEAFHKDMTTNVLGPALVAQAFLPLLERSSTSSDAKPPVVVNMSSGIGSIGRKFGAVSAVYSMSKTALNMLTYKQSAEKENIIWIAMNPGWVKTDMGGPEGQFEVGEGVAKIVKITRSVTTEDSGTFKNHTGEDLPW